MAVLLFVAFLISSTESSSCIHKKFTKTPTEVQNSCFPENIDNRWRGELNYTRTETYIELRWKKIVQDPDCVKAMEFFVDDVKAKDIWGSHNENVRIDKIGTFSLKIQVFFLKSGTSGNCYGSNRKCRCFEATTHLNVHVGNHDDNDYDNKGDGSDTNNVNAEESTHCDLALGGAFGGGECFIYKAVIITSLLRCSLYFTAAGACLLHSEDTAKKEAKGGRQRHVRDV